MVYINSDGRVLQTTPAVQRIKNVFWGIVDFFHMFLVTLIPPLGNVGQTNYRNSSGGGGSGRRPPPGPPRGGFGRVHTLPPPPCGPSGG